VAGIQNSPTWWESHAISQRTPQHWLNTDAFAVPRPFTVGNAGRFIVRADKFANWDFSVFKRWPFQEKRSVELRGEFFNLFNNVNFGYPGGLLNTTAVRGGVEHAQSG